MTTPLQTDLEKLLRLHKERKELRFELACWTFFSIHGPQLAALVENETLAREIFARHLPDIGHGDNPVKFLLCSVEEQTDIIKSLRAENERLLNIAAGVCERNIDLHAAVVVPLRAELTAANRRVEALRAAILKMKEDTSDIMVKRDAAWALKADDKQGGNND